MLKGVAVRSELFKKKSGTDSSQMSKPIVLLVFRMSVGSTVPAIVVWPDHTAASALFLTAGTCASPASDWVKRSFALTDYSLDYDELREPVLSDISEWLLSHSPLVCSWRKSA